MDFENFLRTPIYAMNFRFMLMDVVDFLRTSEQNLDALYAKEMQDIEKEEVYHEFKIDRAETAEHRFRVALPLRIRYAGVVAVVTTVEWHVGLLAKRLKVPPPTAIKGKSSTVCALDHMNLLVGGGRNEEILNFDALTKIRNCISHAAGLERDYEYAETLPEFVGRLKGFSIGDWHMFGLQVCIDRNSVELYAMEIQDVVYQLHKALSIAKHLHKKA